MRVNCRGVAALLLFLHVSMAFQGLRTTTGIALNKRRISPSFALSAAKVELAVSKPQAFVDGVSRTIKTFMNSSVKSKIIVCAHMIPFALLYVLVTSKIFKAFCSKILTALTSVVQGTSKQTKSSLTESIEKAKVEASKKLISNAEQDKIKAMDESARKVAAEKVKKLAEEEEARAITAKAMAVGLPIEKKVESVAVPVVASPVVKKVEPKAVAVVPVVDSEPVFAPWAVEARAKATTNVVPTAEVQENNGRDQMAILLATAAIVSPLMAILQQQ